MEKIYLAITKYDSERIKFIIFLDENSKELIGRNLIGSESLKGERI
jgi:hypothetical protein